MLEETQYSEYVGLRPFSIKEFNSAYLNENNMLTNIPQGKMVGMFVTNDFLGY